MFNKHDQNISLFGLICIFLSFISFRILNHLLLRVIPKAAQNTSRQKWKWKNIMNSLIHSIITGLSAVVCFLWYPEMFEDLLSSYSVFAHILVAFSVGYFIHDFIDISTNFRNKSSYELIIHHMFAITCFGLTVVTAYYIGYGVVALLVEINSAFLHLRQLMIIVGTSKTDFWYRLNSLTNIFTYIIFRFAVLGWMTRWLILHKHDLSVPVYTLGSVGLTVIIFMSFVLFIRLCMMDFTSYGRIDQELKVNSKNKMFEDGNVKSSSSVSKGRNFHVG